MGRRRKGALRCVELILMPDFYTTSIDIRLNGLDFEDFSFWERSGMWINYFVSNALEIQACCLCQTVSGLYTQRVACHAMPRSDKMRRFLSTLTWLEGRKGGNISWGKLVSRCCRSRVCSVPIVCSLLCQLPSEHTCMCD